MKTIPQILAVFDEGYAMLKDKKDITVGEALDIAMSHAKANLTDEESDLCKAHRDKYKELFKNVEREYKLGIITKKMKKEKLQKLYEERDEVEDGII